MFLQLSTSIGDYNMLTFLINLCEDGTESSWIFVVTQCSICDESIVSVSTWVTNHRF